MRFIPLIVSGALLAILLWGLNTPLSVGKNVLPPLGGFINPYSGFWANADPVYADGKIPAHTLSIPGLTGRVEVLFDEMQVPHIFAENEPDAYRAQGYVMARHRLWQMDISARQTAGRLSEILGDRVKSMDKIIRRRGLARAAEDDWAEYQKNEFTRTMMEAYADGVNAYIHELSPADYPLEYKLLNYAPEEWTPLKSCLVIEGMIDALNKKDSDLASSNSLALLGRDTFDYLFPLWYPKQIPIVQDTGQWGGLKKNQQGLLSGLHYSLNEVPERVFASPFEAINGSNNWAVDGSRTVSGAPILCNDTHLPLRLPHVWYQLQLHLPDYTTYGINVAGVPGVVIGFNKDIAWGFTNVSQEVADWYKIYWTDATKTKYTVDGEVLEAELRVEEIKIARGATILDTVRYTIFGPVVYEDSADALCDYAYRYTTHDPPSADDLEHFFSINKGKNYSDYRRAIPGLDCLSQNVAFASSQGDIAITVQGNFPIRAHEQGRFLQEGNSRDNLWKGYIPQEELPTLYKPSRGFVFSANQHSTDPSYPYYYAGRFDDSRARQIYSRLKDMHQITADSMKTIQMDNRSLRARDALQAMLPLVNQDQLSPDELKLYEELSRWDARYLRDERTPSVFTMWLDTCYNYTWDEMDANRMKGIPVLYPSIWKFSELLESDPECVFFDYAATKEIEDASAVVTHGLKVVAAIVREMEPEKLVWYRFKKFAIMHTAQIPAFSRMDVVTDGTRHTPNATDSDHGPSFRMIVELGERPVAWGVYPGGQSGNPGSPYYDDLVDDWAAGKYRRLNFWLDASADGKQITERMEFTPQN
jgi:penicillin amidase